MTIAAIMPQLQRAQAMLQSGQAAAAWLLLAPLRPAIAGHGQALRLYALAAQQVGRTDDALDALKRIASLEDDPPDILGAMADMLGSAGRHGEALALWGSLVAKHPELPDAHLNRAVTAANAGQHELAIEAAEAGLRRFPDHARLLATRAMALKNAGQVQASIDAFAAAVAADPNRALTRHNQGVAFRAACRFEEACEAFAQAERLGLKGAQFHANWAAAALEAGDVDLAAGLYGKALAEDPAHRESMEALTRLEIEYRGGQKAFAHYEQSAGTRRTPEAWIEWIQALSANDRFEEAATIGERGLSLFPGHAGLVTARAFSAGMSGDAAAALDELGSLPASYLAQKEVKLARAQLALRAGRPELAERLADECRQADPNNQSAWSLLGLAWRLLGDPREQWLCDYERLVMVADVPPPDKSVSPADYALEVAAVLDPLHVTGAAPGNQTLRGGTQTSGALFDRGDPAIQRFKQAVLIAAAAAIADLPDDPTHPFLARKSPRLGFSGSWSVRLQGGGFHVHHFHAQGWMSSAYYARLPENRDQGARERHEGWIQFGVPPANFNLDLQPRRIVEPRPGRLVLFPSYMWHGTIPFGEGDRLTAAFDYLPL